jgi:hypothetical protein
MAAQVVPSDVPSPILALKSRSVLASAMILKQHTEAARKKAESAIGTTIGTFASTLLSATLTISDMISDVVVLVGWYHLQDRRDFANAMLRRSPST